MTEHKLEIGSFDVVIIEKLFGPTICADLRITANTTEGYWIIERMWINTMEWIEWCRIPIQINQEFSNDYDDAN